MRRTWAREGIYDVLETVYDRILVYGERDVYDVAREYGFSPRVAAKTCHVGYLRKHRGQRPREAVHAELGLRSHRLLVVVTAGGGEDGFHLLRAALEAIRRAPRASSFDCLLVAGPLMPAAERCRLRELAAGVPSARLVDFVPSLADCIAAADGVVSMGGYNTISEILSFERPALVVPRVAPRREQLIRAELLSRRGLVRVLHPAELTPGRLLAEMTELLERPPALRAPVALDGLSRVADELEAIAPSADREELALSCA